MLNNFHYAMSLAQTLYDIEGDMEDMEEIDNELFSLEYFEQCKKILNVDKFLLNERMKIINKKESEEQ